MRIGIVCYASVGGSGIIATELGKSLAARGHDVHLLSSDTPFRLSEYQPGLTFHRVETPSYPLFREPQYLLSLANKIVQVSRQQELDVVHAHYAVPHATAAYLAGEMLRSTCPVRPPPVLLAVEEVRNHADVGGDGQLAISVRLEAVGYCRHAIGLLDAERDGLGI